MTMEISPAPELELSSQQKAAADELSARLLREVLAIQPPWARSEEVLACWVQLLVREIAVLQTKVGAR